MQRFKLNTHHILLDDPIVVIYYMLDVVDDLKSETLSVSKITIFLPRVVE